MLNTFKRQAKALLPIQTENYRKTIYLLFLLQNIKLSVII